MDDDIENGLYCAERVLSTIANELNIDSPLVPRIATGLCSGMGRTCGPCGALTGGILALNLALGRDDASQSVERNYAAVQELTERFKEEFGETTCAGLLGCDLGTPEGQRKYNSEQLGRRCYRYSQVTIELIRDILKKA